LNFGDWIKDKRIEADLTQVELAKKLGATQATIWTWENGTSRPGPKYRKAIENFFGVSYEDVQKIGSFAEWLRQAREKEGLTQAQLAESSGVSHITISFIETGRTTSPRQSTIELLTKILGEPTKDTAEQLEVEREVKGLGEYLGPFAVDEWEANVESVSAIYVLYDNIDRPVRIGQTKDLKRRLREYKDNYWWFRSPTVESFAYVIVPDENTRRIIEKTIIKFMGSNALFNKQDKIKSKTVSYSMVEEF
jgi:transcriptional regulator with XRE-family HTH domain